MSNDREKILGAVRRATSTLPEPARYPEWESDMVVTRNQPAGLDLKGLFRHRFESAHGVFIDGYSGLLEVIRAHGGSRGYVAPELADALRPHLPGIDIETEFDRNRVDDYSFGITRATGAIAETGSLILTDRDTPARLGALAPWLHIAVLDAAHIHPDVPAAVASFDMDPSIVVVTGPSKTADIEGILIEGVHGPGKQACCVV